MTKSRITLALVAAALVAALAAASIAAAAKPGSWQDTKRQLYFGVSQSGKRFTNVDWTCKKNHTVVAGWPNNNGPKIHRHGKFKFKVAAKVVSFGQPGKDVKLRMEGRFVKRGGKPRAIGTVKSGDCGKRAKRF